MFSLPDAVGIVFLQRTRGQNFDLLERSAPLHELYLAVVSDPSRHDIRSRDKGSPTILPVRVSLGTVGNVV